MCAVSVISDYGKTSITDWGIWENHQEFQKLLDAAKVFDMATKQPDCPSEEKTEWLEANGFYY